MTGVPHASLQTLDAEAHVPLAERHEGLQTGGRAPHGQGPPRHSAPLCAPHTRYRTAEEGPPMPPMLARTSFQCARPGWRPRPLSWQRLAHAIAQSIREARQRGETRPITLYTHDLALATMVQGLLDAEVPRQGSRDS